MKRTLRGRRGRLVALFGVLACLFFLPPLPAAYEDLRADSSLILTDREGTPLRRTLSNREGVNSWVALESVPPILVDAVVLAEDRRFFYHPGADPLAMARAGWQNFRARGVVSGASTITQQLLRTLAVPPEPSLTAKLREVYWALRLDARYSKEEILEAYLNRVAFGPNVHGVEEASRYYFDKPVGALSPAEAAALAVTIRSPSALDPFTESGRLELKRWTEPLLLALAEDGTLSPEAARRAVDQELELSPQPPPFLAPHFCDLAGAAAAGRRGRLATTLDLSLQVAVEGAVRSHLALLREHEVGNAAVVVADVETGEILAMVGSRGFGRGGDGQHNAAISLRQPGSTIKPFTFALLLESTGNPGFILPDLDLYEDAQGQSFVPDNYDRRFHGPVSIRTSLGSSYNVPAVRALERVGVESLLDLLRKGGFEDLLETPEHYGLGLTLGDGPVSLLQLVAAYRIFAQGGSYSPPRLFLEAAPGPVTPALSPRSSYLITDILSDRQARIPSFGTPNVLEFPFPVAVKTGTSKGYRDNWCVGYTPRHVVGVWVGNSDGSPMRNVSGITGAGPLFRDVMLTLGAGGEFSRPSGLVRAELCTLSGQAPGAHCPSRVNEWLFEEAKLEGCQVCRLEGERYVADVPPLYRDWARRRGLPLSNDASREPERLRFVFPQSGDLFLLDADLRRNFQRVKFRVAGGTPPYRWRLNGVPSGVTDRDDYWWELRPGEHLVEVVDEAGESTSITVQVLGSSSTG